MSLKSARITASLPGTDLLHMAIFQCRCSSTRQHVRASLHPWYLIPSSVSAIPVVIGIILVLHLDLPQEVDQLQLIQLKEWDEARLLDQMEAQH